MDKIFKTYDEQIQILVNRGLFISPREYRKLKFILQREGYYKLINGYQNLFLDTSVTDEKFIKGTTIDEIFSLYCFDRDLREIFMRHILHIETNIKSLIAYTISQRYGHDNYLKYKNFNTQKRTASQDITRTIFEFQHAISKNYADPCISHYLTNYGYIPMWVLNNIITLGNISRFYSIMKTDDRQTISRKFKVLDNEMESFLLILSIIRNFSAHGNRLFCIRTKRPLIDTKVHSNLSIPKKNGNEFIFGKRDLFAAVIAIKYLVSANEYKRFHKELKGSINKLKSNLHTIPHTFVLQQMGFPANWTDLIKRDIQH